MVKLRLKRMGRKFQPFYRIVAADERAPRDGKFIEEIGFYNPFTKELKINLELKDKWISQGAKASDTVKTLVSKYTSLKGNGNVISLPIVIKTKNEAPKLISEEETQISEVVQEPKDEEQ